MHEARDTSPPFTAGWKAARPARPHTRPHTRAHDVVQAQHVGAAELKRAAERVAKDGRPQVTHVHLLGHVGRGEVDDDPLARVPRRRPAGDARTQHAAGGGKRLEGGVRREGDGEQAVRGCACMGV